MQAEENKLILKKRAEVAAQLGGWGTLRDFAEWYMSLGAPLLCPSDTEVYVSDDAVTFPIFRHENYQVELYVLTDPVAVPEHGHPFVEVIQCFMVGDESCGWADFTSTLRHPQTHGGTGFVPFMNNKASNRKLLLTFEKWPKNVKPSTLAAVWKGNTVGPLQEALIRRFFPNAYIKDGYADITRQMQ